jgi:hypothetical protein
MLDIIDEPLARLLQDRVRPTMAVLEQAMENCATPAKKRRVVFVARTSRPAGPIFVSAFLLVPRRRLGVYRRACGLKLFP